MTAPALKYMPSRMRRTAHRMFAAIVAVALPTAALTGLAPTRDAKAVAVNELKWDGCTYSGSGSTWTSSPGAVSASLVGSPTYSASSGGYFQLNGTSQYINITSNSTLSLSTSTARTYQLWIRPSSIPGSGSYGLLGKYSASYGWDGYYLGIDTGGYLRFFTNGTGIVRSTTAVTAPLAANQWYLVTVVAQISATAGSTKVYVNNTNVINTAHGSDGYSESNDLRVGNSIYNEYFHGQIGSFHAYERALTTSEISDSYTAFSSGSTPVGCDTTPPTVQSFTSSDASPTNAASVTYSLTFSEAVTGVAAGDFTNAGTASSCTFSPGSDTLSTTRTVTVNGCGTGTVQPSFALGGATDAAGNTGPASAAAASTTITIDSGAPSATWTPPSSPSPSRTLAFGLAFSEPVSGIAAGDFTVTGTATGCTVAPSASSTSSSVTVTVTCTSDGSVQVRLTQNSVVDSASNTGPASDATSSSVTVSTAVSTTTQAGVPTTVTVQTTVPPSTIPATGASVVTTPVVAPTTTTPARRTASTVSSVVPSAATTVPLPTTSTSTTTTLAPVDVPETEVGGAATLIDGEQVSTKLTRENNELFMKAGPLSVRMWGTARNGGKVPLDADGRIRLMNGDSVSVELEGFDPGADAEVRLYSDPLLLGRSVVGPDGSLTASYEIPASAPSGNHNIVFISQADGQDASFSLSIALGRTDGGINAAAIAIPIGLAVAGAMFMPVVIRRRRRAALPR